MNLACLTSRFPLLMAIASRRGPTRQLVIGHLLLLSLTIASFELSGDWRQPLALGNVLLVAGIVEGALLIGWRLTRIPKSQALEFILVSSLQPERFLLLEAAVSSARFVLVTLSGAPILLLLRLRGIITTDELFALIALPMAWGLATGFGLAAWAYEPIELRRIGERIMIGLVVAYLVVGVLIGENLMRWLSLFPPRAADAVVRMLMAIHDDNPFGLMRNAIHVGPEYACFGSVAGLLMTSVCLYRTSTRLLPHFHDLHYRPIAPAEDEIRPRVGTRPLSWWAVKRVGNYSGRINLWLAGGFASAFSAYMLAGDHWPAWLGRQVFVTFENLGGAPMLTTALVLLAAVPAAFQYGLWDHDAQDRCRRLELLLLTELDGRAYWEASFAAAWDRGRGYMAFAGILWLAGFISGQMSLSSVLAAAASAAILWCLYFALGFWAFSSGMQATNLGMILTLIVPLTTFVAHRFGLTALATLLPPGTLFFADRVSPSWLLGPLVAAVAALVVARVSLNRCEASLRRWLENSAA